MKTTGASLNSKNVWTNEDKAKQSIKKLENLVKNRKWTPRAHIESKRNREISECVFTYLDNVQRDDGKCKQKGALEIRKDAFQELSKVLKHRKILVEFVLNACSIDRPNMALNAG